MNRLDHLLDKAQSFFPEQGKPSLPSGHVPLSLAPQVLSVLYEIEHRIRSNTDYKRDRAYAELLKCLFDFEMSEGRFPYHRIPLYYRLAVLLRGTRTWKWTALYVQSLLERKHLSEEDKEQLRTHSEKPPWPSALVDAFHRLNPRLILQAIPVDTWEALGTHKKVEPQYILWENGELFVAFGDNHPKAMTNLRMLHELAHQVEAIHSRRYRNVTNYGIALGDGRESLVCMIELSIRKKLGLEVVQRGRILGIRDLGQAIRTGRLYVDRYLALDPDTWPPPNVLEPQKPFFYYLDGDLTFAVLKD